MCTLLTTPPALHCLVQVHVPFPNSVYDVPCDADRGSTYGIKTTPSCTHLQSSRFVHEETRLTHSGSRLSLDVSPRTLPWQKSQEIRATGEASAIQQHFVSVFVVDVVMAEVLVVTIRWQAPLIAPRRK